MSTSPHFSDAELRCRHCQVNLVKPELLAALEALRSRIQKPIRVTSAYRCQAYDNQVQVGSAHPIVNSVHVQGIAADILVVGMTARELTGFALEIPAFANGGVGRDDFKDYIHVDVRGKFARWCYNQGGDWIQWYDKNPDASVLA